MINMNQILKAVSIILFLIFGMILFSSKTIAVLPEETAINNPYFNNNQKGSSSKTLYLNNCARCHGADGKGGTELGKLYGATDLTAKKVKKMSRKKIARIIQNGDGSMPAFKKKLSSNEITILANYIRNL